MSDREEGWAAYIEGNEDVPGAIKAFRRALQAAYMAGWEGCIESAHAHHEALRDVVELLSVVHGRDAGDAACLRVAMRMIHDAIEHAVRS